MKKIFFMPHLGLGDHFTCNGMTRELYKDCDLMVMIVKENNLKVVRRMFSDLGNLHLLPLQGSMDYSDTQHIEDAVYFKNMFQKRGYSIKSVGVFSDSFERNGKKYDEVFYEQAGIDFSKRWSSFYYPRSVNNEQKMFYECFEGLKKKEYVFLHDDPDRGRVIDRSSFPKNIKVITPHKRFWDADILDYRYVLENALEIHCVNSSFSDLMDSFDLSGVEKLTIHEYARQEDPVNYKNNFNIIYNRTEK
jgi:hypothetical protein